MRMVSPRSAGDDHKMLPGRAADQEETVFVLRMVWVGDGERQRVSKRRGGVREADAVFAEIGGGFSSVPGELEGHPAI